MNKQALIAKQEEAKGILRCTMRLSVCEDRGLCVEGAEAYASLFNELADDIDNYNANNKEWFETASTVWNNIGRYLVEYAKGNLTNTMTEYYIRQQINY